MASQRNEDETMLEIIDLEQERSIIVKRNALWRRKLMQRSVYYRSSTSPVTFRSMDRYASSSRAVHDSDHSYRQDPLAPLDIDVSGALSASWFSNDTERTQRMSDIESDLEGAMNSDDFPGAMVVKSATGPTTPQRSIRLDQLPMDVLIHIFSFLPTLPNLITLFRVCKRFASASIKPSLWTKLSFRGFEQVKDTNIQSLVKYSGRVNRLQALNLSCCHSLSATALMIIPRLSFGTLASLDLSNCIAVTDDSIQILSQCTELRQVSFAGCTKLSHLGLTSFFRDHIRLKEVNISHCFKIRSCTLQALALSGSTLTTLRAANCNMYDADLIHLGNHCPKLSIIDFSFCHRVSDFGIVALSEGCENITELKLSQTRVSDEGVLHTVTKHSSIVTLVLARCSQLHDICMGRVESNLRDLQVLDISYSYNISDLAVEQIIDSCKQLTLLDISLFPSRKVFGIQGRTKAVVYF